MRDKLCRANGWLAGFQLLLLLLLAEPNNANAQIEWSTYCDNGVEKVQLSLVYNLAGVDSVLPSDAGAYNNEVCGELNFCSGRQAVPEDLGDGNYRFTWRGWLRSCLTVDMPAFHAVVFFYASDPGQEPTLFQTEIWCEQFEQVSIVDNVECTPLPVAESTWGAVKALYR